MDTREQERKLLGELKCPESDALIKPGVLLSDQIKRLVDEYKLIDPFNPDNLKPAGYELSVGDEYSRGGGVGKLYDESGKKEVVIEPFQVLIIKTKERVNLPRFLIARWNIRVKYAYEGLLWVGGPQVDPGYVGHLFCPIYNLSNKKVTLRLGDPIALIDFVTTTPFSKDSCKVYDRPPKRVLFEDYNPDKLQSALYTEARERIDEVKEKVDRVEHRFNTSIGIIFTVMAVLVTTLSIIVTSTKGVDIALPWWIYINSGFSILALVLSILSWSKRYSPASKEQHLENSVRDLDMHSKFFAAALLVIAVAIWLIARTVPW